jgi:hypothetical protein
MPRTYAKILTSIWSDADFRALSADAQRVYIVLLTQRELSACGCLPLRVSKWAKLAPDTTVSDVRVALDQLSEARFVVVDEDSEELLIRSFIRHDGGWQTPNIHKAILSTAAVIESENLRAVAFAELDKTAGRAPPGNPSETLTGCRSEAIPEPLPMAFASPLALQPFSLQPDPETSSSSPSAARAHLAENCAAEAIEVLLQHRLDTEPNIRDRPRYATALRERLTDDHRLTLNTTRAPKETEPVRWLAVNVLGLTVSQAMTAAVALRNNGGTAQ